MYILPCEVLRPVVKLILDLCDTWCRVPGAELVSSQGAHAQCTEFGNRSTAYMYAGVYIYLQACAHIHAGVCMNALVLLLIRSRQTHVLTAFHVSNRGTVPPLCHVRCKVLNFKAALIGRVRRHNPRPVRQRYKLLHQVAWTARPAEIHGYN